MIMNLNKYSSDASKLDPSKLEGYLLNFLQTDLHSNLYLLYPLQDAASVACLFPQTLTQIKKRTPFCYTCIMFMIIFCTHSSN